jgi:peptide/nickel transport system substrate-binding protein
MNASCDKAKFGWPCDAELEKLRDDYARMKTTKLRRRANRHSSRHEIGTHVPLGEYLIQVAARKHQGIVIGYFLVPWNVEKQ